MPLSLSLSFSPPPAYKHGFSIPTNRSRLIWDAGVPSILSAYNQAVDKQINVLMSTSIQSPDDIEQLTSSISNILISSAHKHIPCSTPRPYVRFNWNTALKQAQSASKNKYREWVIGGKPSNPTHPLKVAYKEAKRSFRRVFRKCKRSETEEFYKSLDLSNPNLFSIIKRKTGHSTTLTTTLQVNNQLYQDGGMYEAWAAYFRALYSPSMDRFDNHHLEVINNSVQDLFHSPSNVDDILFFTPEEIQSLLQTLPKKKASGPDLLSMEHLIHAPEKVGEVLSSLFNGILRLHYIPSSFLCSLIIPLFKGGGKDPTLPNNYRGISLSSNLSKLFERLLLPRLQSKLLSLIHPLQGGFRPGYSSSHTSYLLHEAIAECKHQDKSAYVALLDVQKAFDTVWHNGLFYKLFQFGIRGDIWYVLYNWYSRLSSSVIWDDRISRDFPVAQGVRQGAVLSPILYAVYTSDLLSTLEDSGLGVYISHLFVGAPTYADDMSLIATAPWALQAMFQIVYEYSYKWRYSINPSKSQIIIAHQRAQSMVPFQWCLDGHVIPVVESAKHLGIIISSSPSTIKRTTNAITSSRSAFYALTAVGARHTCINPCTSLHLYKTLSLPILSYAFNIWSPTSTEITMMERSQLKILRTILGLPLHVPTKGIHLLAGTIPIQLVIVSKQLSFIRSTLALADDATPRRLLMLRGSSQSLPASSITRSYISNLESLSLPSISDLASELLHKHSWKAIVKTLLYESFRDESTASPSPSMVHIARLPLPHYGRPSQVLHEFRSNLTLARLSHLRVRFLLHATTLASHTSVFSPREGRDRSPVCTLCSLNQPEDLEHFICSCPALQQIRDMWLPKIYGSTLPCSATISDHVLGIVWIDHQDSILKFLADIYQYRVSLQVISFH